MHSHIAHTIFRLQHTIVPAKSLRPLRLPRDEVEADIYRLNLRGDAHQRIKAFQVSLLDPAVQCSLQGWPSACNVDLDPCDRIRLAHMMHEGELIPAHGERCKVMLNVTPMLDPGEVTVSLESHGEPNRRDMSA